MLELIVWMEVEVSAALIMALMTVLVVPVRTRSAAAVAMLAGPALGGGLLLAPLVLLFSAAHRQRRTQVLVALVVWTAVTSTVLVFWPLLGSNDVQVALRVGVDSAAGAVMAAGAVTMGRLLRVGEERSASMRELVAGRARERALAEHAARVDERLRLAREMHDVVASQVTVIAVQAGALCMVAADTQRVAEVAEVIRAAAAQTTRELREALTALRAPTGGIERLHGVRLAAAAEGLEQVQGLWDASGLPGELVLAVPEEHRFSVSAQRAVYLVICEGLTNAARHAPGALIRAGVEMVALTVVVSVVNGPVPPAGLGGGSSRELREALSTGNGLVGIKERAQEVGGHASWGATPQGGISSSWCCRWSMTPDDDAEP